MTNVPFGAWTGIAGWTNILGNGQFVAYTDVSGPARTIYYRGRVNLK